MNVPLLFLTGCINPNNITHTLLLDSDIRYKQYVEAIFFYLKETDLPILFVENSGVDISKEFNFNNNRIEILTFYGNVFERHLGKGFGEMEIIEYALKRSKKIKHSDFIFKITGRYKILNINSLINQYYQLKPQIQVLVDLRKSLSFSDSRFWGAEKDFFKRLIEYKDLVNDSRGFFFEHALSKLVLQQIIEGRNYSFIKNLPRYSGIYATNNTNYNDSWIYWFPRNIKHNLRYYLMKY